MSRAVIRQQSRTTRAQAPLAGRPATDFPVWLTAVAAVIVVLVLVLGHMTLRARVEAQSERSRADRLAAVAAAQERPCEDGAAVEEDVRALVATGETATAAKIARMKLVSDTLCQESHASLAALWYEAEMEGLLGGSALALAAGDQAAMVAWRGIEETADELGVAARERWPGMRVAERAYLAGAWALADAAFRHAWASRQLVSVPIEFRYALLRNWGNHLAGGDRKQRDQGKALLATACAIGERHGLADGQAREDLVQFFAITDCQAAGPDAGEPALATDLRERS